MSRVNRQFPRRSRASESTYSRMEFERQFPDDAACLGWLVQKLYPNGIHCPTCKAATKHHRESKRPSYACQNCGHHEHPMKGTIFEDSATSLKLWFTAIFIMSATRCGVSAKQLERDLGVTYKCAWRIFNKIRSLLEENDPLGGKVESDESFYGGKEGNKHWHKRADVRGVAAAKTTVWGAVERDGRVIARVIPDRKGDTIGEHVRRYVLPASTIFTDEGYAYDQLPKMGYQHKRVRHNVGVYVSGDAHTNTIEGFWSLTKNGIRGVYHNVSAKYLQTYLNEYAFRFNRRKSLRLEQPMFDAFVGRITKKASASV